MDLASLVPSPRTLCLDTVTVPKLLADLARAFPRAREQVTQDTLLLYKAQLEDLPLAALALAVNDLIRSEDWFPTVRAIRVATAERVLALPTETQALAQIDARARWAAQGRESGSCPDVHPLVREALDGAGGWYALRSAEQPGILRSQFLKLYREHRSRAIETVQRDGFPVAA